MERKLNPLDDASSRPEPSVAFGTLVRGIGFMLMVGGIVCALLATIGVDNQKQILIGFAIAAFGLIVAILGQILHAVETRR